MTRQRYADLLTSAAQANMNMLRVRGGGIYENDEFYEICDELGLCIWQDFMFACSTYPGFDDAFRASVRTEAEQNVPPPAPSRLHRPLVRQQRTRARPRRRSMERLPDELGRTTASSSTSSCPKSVASSIPSATTGRAAPTPRAAIARTTMTPPSGDAHLWDVWHGRKPFEWYRTCTHRFNSEFGFQSFPEPRTVAGYTEPRDRNVTTYVMEHHQRSGIGNAVIMQYMLDWFRLPTSFDATLWLSQIQQGMAMKYAVEHWRRGMPRGMGTLYWQLNDCWPVASWASIDYHGRWKALHHMARHFNNPLLISGVEDLDKGTVELHVTSDRLTPTNADVSWTLTDLAGQTIDIATRAALIAPSANALVTTLDPQATPRRWRPA